MSDTAVINVNLPQKEDPLAVLWRKHFSSMAEGDWNSVEAVSAHISKFYQLLVSDGLEGSKFSKLPDEVLEMISSMLEHKERDVAPPTSGITDLRRASHAFYTDVMVRALWPIICPAIPRLAVQGYIAVTIKMPPLGAWLKLHKVEGMSDIELIAAAVDVLRPRIVGQHVGLFVGPPQRRSRSDIEYGPSGRAMKRVDWIHSGGLSFTVEQQ